MASEKGAAFSDDDLKAIKAILEDLKPVHADNDKTAREHIKHCLDQLVRFAHLAAAGHPFRAVQWGMNFGRAQELLRSRGGLAAWWHAFEPILIKEDWTALEALARRYLDLFGLEQPSEEFINRV